MMRAGYLGNESRNSTRGILHAIMICPASSLASRSHALNPSHACDTFAYPFIILLRRCVFQFCTRVKRVRMLQQLDLYKSNRQLQDSPV